MRHHQRMFGDTTPEQLERHAALLSQRTPEERAAALRVVDRGGRRLALAGLRARHPGADERELMVRLVAQVHGAQAARRAYGGLPEDLEP
jgi:hypothetical protein